jgi:hypothetical protein
MNLSFITKSVRRKTHFLLIFLTVFAALLTFLPSTNTGLSPANTVYAPGSGGPRGSRRLREMKAGKRFIPGAQAQGRDYPKIRG